MLGSGDTKNKAQDFPESSSLSMRGGKGQADERMSKQTQGVEMWWAHSRGAGQRRQWWPVPVSHLQMKLNQGVCGLVSQPSGTLVPWCYWYALTTVSTATHPAGALSSGTGTLWACFKGSVIKGSGYSKSVMCSIWVRWASDAFQTVISPYPQIDQFT